MFVGIDGMKAYYGAKEAGFKELEIDLRAEITQLRAELEKERELADRLAKAAKNVCYIERPYDLDDAIAEHGVRRADQATEVMKQLLEDAAKMRERANG